MDLGDLWCCGSFCREDELLCDGWREGEEGSATMTSDEP